MSAMRSSRNKHRHPSGFTLMELLLVMSLLVVLSGTAMVGIARFTAALPLDQSVERLRLEFTRTRLRAIDEGVPWQLALTGPQQFERRQEQGPADISENREIESVELPESVTATAAVPLRFFPDGSVFGSAIMLTDEQGVACLLVPDRLTGMLQLQTGAVR